ncbi:hypothetical protein EDB84DRAFT_1516200 [Lactarius hengduanensis]|nr:hypothetical protein EDB84DRAFT_1516200 [Lactarius hengduanensis]
MRRSFPVLTHLYLAWDLNEAQEPSRGSRDVPSVIPSRFLGGSAPHLQHFRLRNVPFPHLPTFLLSARNLITLEVENICQNGYISPEAMVRGLAVLTRLITLSITFDELSVYDQTNRPDPAMRIALPALTTFHCQGYSGYLEDFLAQIDTPQVDDFRIEYFLHEVQATQLSRFLDRTENLKLDQLNRAKVTFHYNYAQVELNSSRPQGEHEARLTLVMNGGLLDTQVPYVVQALGQLAHTFSHVDHLDAHGDDVELVEFSEVDMVDWVPFFHLFPAVETLHLSGGVAAYIVSALDDPANSEEMVTDVFPELHLIWLDDMDNNGLDEPVGSIERFLALRQLNGFPVTVVDTEDEFYQRC